MTVLADYTAEEQELIRHAVASAAIAVSAASPGRKEETVSEGYAAADLVLKSQPRFVGNTLVASLIVQVEAEVQAGRAFPDYVERVSSPGAFDEAMILLGRVNPLLEAKSTPEEAAGYKRWLVEIAQAVAEAGKEDQGFLGRGGVQVNDAERSAIEGIARTLGVEVPKAP